MDQVTDQKIDQPVQAVQPVSPVPPAPKKDFFQAPHLKWIIIAVGAVIVLLFVFQLGAYVGYRKADFAFKWGSNYNRAFGGPQGGFMNDFGGRDLVSGHGTAGTIAKVESADIIVNDSSGTEKTIDIGSDTTIRKGTSSIKITDLKVDQRVVVIGSPKDDGSIDAKIVRVFDPADPTSMQATPQSQRQMPPGGFAPSPSSRFN